MDNSTGKEGLLLCYNKGCGKTYSPLNSKDDDCCHHPGNPVFHDAYKGWSCCNKKSTDFTTFLNTKGCTLGKHNPEKPPEPEKIKSEGLNNDEVITVRPPMEVSTERPDFDTEMTNLKVTISQSLSTALENAVNATKVDSAEETNDLGIRVGESCKNNSCTGTYEGEASNLEICHYHPGFPVFHEGMKYWSCCNKKTSDFDVFLSQKGCANGSHLWIKKTVKKASCRYDWHQTATHVTVTVYSKLAQPNLTIVRANPIRLDAKIVFGQSCQFDLDQELGGVIDTSQSTVMMVASKVEIHMKKADCKNWNKLFLPTNKLTNSDNGKKNSGDSTTEIKEDPNLDVDAIDLNDL